MSARRLFSVGSLVACAVPALAVAHPGHGVDGGSQSWLHYMLEPTHAAVGLGAAALVLVGFLALRRRRQHH